MCTYAKGHIISKCLFGEFNFLQKFVWGFFWRKRLLEKFNLAFSDLYLTALEIPKIAKLRFTQLIAVFFVCVENKFI